jgi:uncharacterized protein (DUF302 family)
MPFAEAVTAAKAALKDEGFGVLCEIDIAKTLKEKLGEEVEPHLILGACNPQLAHAALREEPNLALLLPCNVVVRQSAGATFIGAIEPLRMLELAGNPALDSIATEASARLNRVLERFNHMT